MNAIRTDNEQAQQDAAHWKILIAMTRMIRSLSDSKLANGKPLVQIPLDNVHLFDLQWAED
jgi:hypothetical protein